MPAGSAELAVYNVAGRRVRTLYTGHLGPGGFVVRWDGRDSAGRPAPSRAYYLCVRSGSKRTQRAFVLR